MIGRVILIAVTVAMWAGAAPATADPAPAPASLQKSVDNFLDPLIRTRNFSGVVLVAKGDRIILEKGYGLASIEHRRANGPDTVFQIASVSKPFTSAAIMTLVEQGKIDLAAPLTKILPDYPGGAKLTVHHLLAHTSGIPNINDFDDYAEVQRRPQTPASLVARFKDKPLEFEPGARYDYSNSNFNLLALIIETVSGLSYGDYLEQAVLGPLKLGNTSHAASAAAIVDNLATGYAPKGAVDVQRADYIDWSVKTGNGSLRSTARDVQKFFRSIHRGSLIGDDSRKRLFTEHTPNVGYGWFVTKANGRALHHVNGRSPGFSAQADYYPDDDVSVIVLSNTYVSVTTEIARAVGAQVFGRQAEPMPALRAEAPSAASTQPLLGTYQFGPDYYVPNAKVEIRRSGGHLEAVVGESAFALVPIDDTTYLLRSFWIPATFVIGADGKASEFRIGDFRGARTS